MTDQPLVLALLCEGWNGTKKRNGYNQKCQEFQMTSLNPHHQIDKDPGSLPAKARRRSEKTAALTLNSI
jgi:hypothetical protein